MSSVRIVAHIFITVGVAFAINCYISTDYSGQKPTKVEQCNSDYCIRMRSTSEGSTLLMYGCDQTQICKGMSQNDVSYTVEVNGVEVDINSEIEIKQDNGQGSDGTYAMYQGSEIFCCSHDLCNSSSKLSALLTILPLVLYKFF